MADSHGSLSDQIAETLHTKILRLELENRRLSAKIKGYHEQSIFQPLNCNLNKGKDSDGCIELAASSQSVEVCDISVCEECLAINRVVKFHRLIDRNITLYG